MNQTRRQSCGTFLNAPNGWRTNVTRSLSCKVVPGVSPVMSANCGQRWTFSTPIFSPSKSPLITAITQQLLCGMQGSCSSGAFKGAFHANHLPQRESRHIPGAVSAHQWPLVQILWLSPASLSSGENKMKQAMRETFEEALRDHGRKSRARWTPAKTYVSLW